MNIKSTLENTSIDAEVQTDKGVKVRIGNDIRIKIQLTFGEDSPASVLSAQAFFINRTLKDKIDAEHKKKNRFIGRFPIEPFTNEFDPTAYCINSTGYPTYKTPVLNAYCGYGYKPNWKNCAPVKDMNCTMYHTSIEYTADPSIVYVDFPARAQRYPGVYDLVVVAKIYDEGYSHNSRTVTVDYKNIFELVSETDPEGQTPYEFHPMLIDVVNESASSGKNDVYVVNGRYDNNSIVLERNDQTDVVIGVSPITEWYEGD